MNIARIRSLVPVADGVQDLVVTAVLGTDSYVHTRPAGRGLFTSERLDRVKAAIRNANRPFPLTTVGIDSDRLIGHEHSIHDLAAAIAVLTAAGDMPPLDDTVVLGALNLDGSLRSTPGIEACLQALRGRTDVRRVIIPGADRALAPLLDGIRILGANTLADVVTYANGRRDALTPAHPTRQLAERTIPPYLERLTLLPWVARGLAAAAAGRHHLLVTTPEPSDRILFAHALAAMLPMLSEDQASALAQYRRHDARADRARLDHVPPLQAHHHSDSVLALTGSPSKPGAAQLATHGVLHLNDAGRRSPDQWEALRQVIDRREVTLSVNSTPTRFTADPLIVLSCVDTASEMRKVPPFIYDRVSVRLHVTRTELGQQRDEESVTLPVLADMVDAARQRAARRWREIGVSTNAEVPDDALRMSSTFPRMSWELLDRHHRAGVLSDRGVLEVRRVAWSLADLDACEHPQPRHIDEAVALRLQSRLAPA